MKGHERISEAGDHTMSAIRGIKYGMILSIGFWLLIYVGVPFVAAILSGRFK